MSKYKKGDKVVIRKDLELGGKYGELYCLGRMIRLKEKDYVVIKEVEGGYYWIGDFFVNDELIEGLYEGNIKPKYNVGDKVLIPKILKSKCGKLDYLVVTELTYTPSYDSYVLNDEFIIEGRSLEGLYEDSNNQLNYKEIEYINYKMQHEDLHQSIYKNNLQYQIDKALDENNTELLIELSNLMKGGVMIDN